MWDFSYIGGGGVYATAEARYLQWACGSDNSGVWLWRLQPLDNVVSREVRNY